MDERRMEAYHYEFTRTGQDAVDKVLSAVACAGKAFHLTEDWNEETFPRDDHTGNSPVEWIQNAAQEAAEHIGAAEARADALAALLREAEEAAEQIAAQCPAEEPPPAYDDWGDQIADTDERHAERVTALRLWELGKIARALLARLEAREVSHAPP